MLYCAPDQLTNDEKWAQTGAIQSRLTVPFINVFQKFLFKEKLQSHRSQQAQSSVPLWYRR